MCTQHNIEPNTAQNIKTRHTSSRYHLYCGEDAVQHSVIFVWETV